MNIPELLLMAATLLCGVTTGFVFAFAVVVMPGIRSLPDRDFLRSFKVMDRVIQNNDPWFMVVWVGSIILLIAAGVTNVPDMSGLPRFLLIGAVATYLLGVQLPTGAANVPLNNKLQTLAIDTESGDTIARSRLAFESRWVFWNVFRTASGIVSTGLLLVVLHLG